MTTKQVKETVPQDRTGETGSDLSIILVTAAQLIFFAYFHRYIAWPVTSPDGSVTRLSMLTDAYFTWLPVPVTASILVILANVIMMVIDNDWFRQAAWVMFCIIGIAVVVSLVVIFPFDFSVLPNPAAVDVVPVVLRVLLIFMAVFYALAAVVLFARLRKQTAR